MNEVCSTNNRIPPKLCSVCRTHIGWTDLKQQRLALALRLTATLLVKKGSIMITLLTQNPYEAAGKYQGLRVHLL
jgi:hypothetical protein